MAAAPWLPLFAVVIDPRFDYFPGVRRLDDPAFLRHIAARSQLAVLRRRDLFPRNQCLCLFYSPIPM
jgi:hypothetical protein